MIGAVSLVAATGLLLMTLGEVGSRFRRHRMAIALRALGWVIAGPGAWVALAYLLVR